MCLPSCPPGEFMLHNCTDTDSAVCWPCEAGFACNAATKTACEPGATWSRAAMAECLPCSGACPAGTLLVRECEPASDRVCAACPAGFGCASATMEMCAPGTYSSAAGECVPCPANRSSSRAGSASADDCVAIGGGCGPNEIVVGTACRECPPGYGCNYERIGLCPANAHSERGKCVACPAHSQSLPGSSSADQCVCDAGYVKTNSSRQCTPCEQGTVWTNRTCVPCPPGDFCTGRTHRETCPRDMYASGGAAECTECRPFSNCGGPRCVGAWNCTCDDGYADTGDECVRCPPGTAKTGDRLCTPCAPGFECAGGAEVAACHLSTYSPGGANMSRCLQCALCPELTRARCNATHDSQCERTTAPLAVISVHQEYRTQQIDGDTFGAFAMVYASALPRAQLQSVCTERMCVDCFQGVCPVGRMRLLGGPVYRLTIEIRSEVNRLFQNVDALSNSAFLLETAKLTMRKLAGDEVSFAAYTRVDHTVICPDDGAVWDGSECAVPRDEATSWAVWASLLLGIGGVISAAVYGSRGRDKRQLWRRVDQLHGAEEGTG
jgi:hypothetical protein